MEWYFFGAGMLAGVYLHWVYYEFKFQNIMDTSFMQADLCEKCSYPNRFCDCTTAYVDKQPATR